MMSTDLVLLAEMTWPQVERAIEGGRTTVIVPCGAVEQHGPHLPLATDDLLGTAIAERAATLAGTALVAPPLSPGLSEHHMGFPGSLTARAQTFVALVEDACTSLARHGFRRIVLFPSHGGNVDMLRAYIPDLARANADRCEVVVSVSGTAAFDEMLDLMAKRGVPIGRAGLHAGYVETAMMLAHRPELVRMEEAEPGRCDDGFYAPEQLRASQLESFLYGVRRQSANGVLGDPIGATAEDGELLLQFAAEALAADVVANLQPQS